MTTLLILVLLAAMWNALAGYGGLVSIGQQAFIGLGAYGTVWLVNHGMNPYQAMIVATLFCGAISLPVSFLVLRFRGAQFAIGMWVRGRGGGDPRLARPVARRRDRHLADRAQLLLARARARSTPTG